MFEFDENELIKSLMPSEISDNFLYLIVKVVI